MLKNQSYEIFHDDSMKQLISEWKSCIILKRTLYYFFKVVFSIYFYWNEQGWTNFVNKNSDQKWEMDWHNTSEFCDDKTARIV